MGWMDIVKEIVPKAGELAEQLGDQAGKLMEELVEKLDLLDQDNKLEEGARSALAAFKPVLEKFKMNEDTLDNLLEKAKELLEKLSKVDLPGELENVIAKISNLFK